jgi:hypothetical protein
LYGSYTLILKEFRKEGTTQEAEIARNIMEKEQPFGDVNKSKPCGCQFWLHWKIIWIGFRNTEPWATTQTNTIRNSGSRALRWGWF